MTMFQFISAALGAGTAGKKAKIKMAIKKASEAIFTPRPQRPKLNLDGKMGLLVQRLQIIQPIDTM